jgi:Ca2+-binding RTX toxin-like protein
MNESKITVTKAARLGVVVFALLAALIAVQTFSAKSAEAGVCLTCSGGAGSEFPTPSQVIWTGTDAPEKKVGSNYSDTMDARGGGDSLYGFGSLDKLYGGSGSDWVSAGAGDDQIYPDGGVSPGAGNDTIYGEDGNDTIYAARDGNVDSFNGGNGYDVVIYPCQSADGVQDSMTNIELSKCQ